MRSSDRVLPLLGKLVEVALTDCADDFVVEVIRAATEPGVPEDSPGGGAELDEGVVGGLACGS